MTNKAQRMLLSVLLAISIAFSGWPMAAAPQAVHAEVPDITTGLVAYYAMEGLDALGKLIDSSPSANNANIYGTPSWENGIVGNAIVLNGSAYAIAPYNSALDLTGPITMAAWIKPTSKSTQRIISKARQNVYDGYELSLSIYNATDPQKVFTRFNQATSGDSYRLNSTSQYLWNGTWQHVAMTFDGSNIKIYYNGQLENSKTTTISIAKNFLGLGIGVQPTQTSDNSPFVGSLDEVRVYNRALSAIEVASLATLPADLSITMIHSQTYLRPGQVTTYSFVVTNPSTQTVSGIRVQDSLPASLTNATWTCTKSIPSASCTSSGAGSINDTVTIPGGATLTYALTASVASNASGSLTNTATVAMPEGATDPNPANNSASDTDAIVNPPSCGNDPSLVGCWQMEEGNGALLYDSTANYNDAQLYGTPSFLWDDGHTGKAISMDGVNQYALVKDSTSLDLTSAITMSAWVKPTATGTRNILGKLVGSGTEAYELDLSTDGYAFVEINGACRTQANTLYRDHLNEWVHLSATYDSSPSVQKVIFYVNGIKENETNCSAAITTNDQPLGIGSDSAGGRKFVGLLDDVRIYNRALSAAEIGELAGLNRPPAQPALVSPTDGATGVSLSPDLSVTATDPDNDPLTVTFFGRPKASVSSQPFTLVAIPDTQTYTTSSAGATLFNTAAQWIVDNQASKNIVFVTHLGDITENGGNDSDDSEWTIAHTALSKLEKTSDPADDVPYGVAPGNHDVLGSPASFEKWFGVSHFSGRSYYLGAYDDGNPVTDPSNLNNASHFTAGGRDFLALQLDCSATPSPAVLTWADSLLKAHPTWQGIVVCHTLLESGSSPSFSAAGQAIYDALKGNPNLFLMLGGHLTGSGHRADIYNGHTVNSLRVDYQGYPNFWLRLLEFNPATNKINVTTYSPDSGASKTDADNQFSLDYNLGAVNFQQIGSPVSIASGGTASVAWPGLALSTNYEWYATVSDAKNTTTGPTWNFTTRAAQPNTPPTAIDDQFSTDEDVALALPLSGPGSPAANDSDPDPGDSLTVVGVSNASGGTVAISGSPQQIVFIPAADLCGTNAGGFDYTVSDGKATDTGTVTIAINCVNDPPSFTKGPDQIVDEDSPAQTVPGWATAIKAGPPDESGQSLNFMISTDNPGLFSTSPAVSTDGTLTYTPAADACGDADVSVWLHDNGGGTATSDLQSFNLTINCINDPPSFTVEENHDQAVAEDSGPQMVTGWAQDISAGPANESTQSLSFIVTNELTSLFSAQPAISETGTLTYTPAPDACGKATVTVRLKDSGGGNDTSAPRTFTIEVTCVNDAPVGVADHYTTALNTPLVVNALTGVLANDTDVDSASRMAALVSDSGPSHGSLNLSADGSFTYTPETGYSGEDSFQYTASDGQATSAATTVTLVVNDTNRAPTCSDQSITTDEDHPGQVDPGCEDLDGDTLTFTIITGPAAGPTHGQATVENGKLVYTPNLNYNGEDSFAYRAFDGRLFSAPATVTVTVKPVNDPPVLDPIGSQSGSEGSPITFTAHATDVDGDTLTYALNPGAPAGAGIDPASGVFTWTPDESQGPSAPSITVRVSDGAAVDSETLTITVSEVNQNPVVSAIPSQTGKEGDSVSLQVAATDADLPANTLSYAANGLPAGLSIDTATGLISGTLAAGSARAEPTAVTITVSDGQGGQGTAGFTWAVNALPGPLTCTALQPKPATTGTGEKPQSKVWQHAGAWWAVFPTGTGGASSAGTWLWKLQGTAWTEVLKLSDSTTVKADALALGDVTHLLLYAGTSTQLVSVEYTGGAYQLWSARTAASSISLPGSETATIAADTTGRMWLATENDSSGSVVVYYADPPYATWSGPISLASGVNADDISDIIAIPGGKVGVLWSNQNTRRFGFRVHTDGTDPSAWFADEVPASASANDSVGTGMADDHLSLTAASNGTLYAAVKTGYDTTGYPKIALLVRRPAGAWDTLYTVDEAGTRPIVLLDETRATLTVIYTSSESYNPIVYRQSPLGAIAFGPRHSLSLNAFNDASSTRQVINGEFAAIYAGSAQVGGVFCTDSLPPASDVDLAITKTDGLPRVRPGQAVTYTLVVTNLGTQLVNGAKVTDTLPAALTNASWICSPSTGSACTASGAGSIADTVSLPAGGTVTYTLRAIVSPEAASSVINTASVAAPEGMTDTQPSNNSSADTDPVVVPPGCGSLAGLAGCWQMEEGSGTAILDSSSAANDGETHNSPARVAGHSGQGLRFNGTSQYVSVPDSPSLDITGSLTLSAWIKPERFATQDLVKKALMGGGLSGSGYEISLANDSSSSPSPRKVFARFNQGKTGDTYRVASTSDYPTDGNTWIHIAATFDSTAGVIRLYINGAEEASLPVPAGFTIDSNDLPLTIGGQSDSTRTFQGTIDDVRVYNRALSLNEIRDLYGNHPPVAAGDSYTVAEDGHLAVNAAAGVLSNDLDPEGKTLTAALVNGPSHGTLTLNPDGSFTYDPTANYNGPDSFTYTASDARFTSPAATVSLTVTPVNDPPYFVMGAGPVVLEDSGAVLVNGWATGISSGPSDEAGQSVVFEVTGNTNPSLFLVGPAISADGKLSFTLAENACGSAEVSLQLKDSEGAIYTPDPSTFTIQVTCVNDPPLAVADSYTTAEDTVLELPMSGVGSPLENDSDIDHDPLTISAVSSPVGGTVEINATLQKIVFTPDANRCAPQGGSFDYTLSDGAASVTGSVAVTLTCVNDPPSFVKGVDQTVDEDSGTQAIAGWATSISAGPANEAGQALDFIVSASQTSLFSTPPAISSDTGALTFTPAANACGAETFSVRLHDAGGGDDTSAPQTFTLTITCVDDPPYFVMGDDQTVLEDAGAQTVNGWATEISAGPADEAAQTLAFAVTHNTNPGLFSAGPALSSAGALTYTPAADACGEAEISLRLDDSGRASYTPADPTFILRVTCVNDPPSFLKGSDQTIEEDSGMQTVPDWATAISAGPANEASQTLTFLVDNNHHDLFSSQPSVSAGGTLTYTPAPDACGTASVSVQLRDDGGGTDTSPAQTFTIQMMCANDAPTAVPDSYRTDEDTPLELPLSGAGSPAANDTDPDPGDTLSVIGVSHAVGGKVTLSGTPQKILFTPEPNLCGENAGSFDYTLSDGQTIVTGTVHVTITCVNDAPVAADDVYEVDQDDVLIVSTEEGLLANDTDAEGDLLFIVWVTGPAHGTIILEVDGGFRYTPAPGYFGPDSFTYRVKDGTDESEIATVRFMVDTVTPPVPGVENHPIYLPLIKIGE